MEDFILKRVGEIVFDEKNIPALIKTYYESLGELCGEGEKIIKKMNSSLKNVNQKICNIVNIITETGSPALLVNLQKLESEKQELEMQIEVEKSKMETNQLNEKEIVAAYRMAQELYQSGALSQRKQLVNLYLKRVLVYTEYVEVELNNVPSNLLKSTLKDEKLPTKNGGQDPIHIYEKWLEIREMFASKMKRTRNSVVEAKQDENIPRKKENELVFDENQLDRLPVILFEGANPLFTTYFVGKQTLKDIYFGVEVIRV